MAEIQDGRATNQARDELVVEEDIDVVLCTLREKPIEGQTNVLLLAGNSFRILADIEESVSSPSLAALEVTSPSIHSTSPHDQDIYPKILGKCGGGKRGFIGGFF